MESVDVAHRNPQRQRALYLSIPSFILDLQVSLLHLSLENSTIEMIVPESKFGGCKLTVGRPQAADGLTRTR